MSKRTRDLKSGLTKSPEIHTPLSSTLLFWFGLGTIALLLPVINVLVIPVWVGAFAAVILMGIGVGTKVVNGANARDRRSESQSFSEGPLANRTTVYRLNETTQTPEVVERNTDEIYRHPGGGKSALN